MRRLAGALLLIGLSVGALLPIELGVWTPLRVAVIVGVLTICPGLAFVRLLEIDDRLTEFTFAVAVSLALVITVATVLLKAGLWSVGRGILVLTALSMVGSMLLIVLPMFRHRPVGGRDREWRG